MISLINYAKKLSAIMFALLLTVHPPVFSQAVTVDPSQNATTPTTPALEMDTDTTATETPTGGNTDPDSENPLSPPTEAADIVATAAFAGTNLPGRPMITTFSNLADISINQTSSSQFRLNYDMTATDSFGGAIINFGESPAGVQNLSSVQEFQFDIATNNVCPAGTPCLRIEFVDNNNQLAVVDIDGLTATASTVAIAQTELTQANPQLDLTAIKQINFVVDQQLTSNEVGYYDIQVGGLAFVPNITATAASGTPTTFPGTPVISTFAHNATADAVQNGNAFTVNYDVTTAESFAGAIINYGGDNQLGSQDLSGVNNFIFNLGTNNNCASGKCFKIEFQDSDNETASATVSGATAQNSQIAITEAQLLDANPNLDLTRIRQINFVIEEANTDPNAGTLTVTTGGFGGTTPIDPVDPTEPTHPTDPIDPTDPTTPTDPIDPTDPADPTTPGDAVFTGITEGQTVTGTVSIQPNLTQTPDIRKVAYYLNGTKAGRNYEAPFAWGEAEGIDTTQLPDGEYTLAAVYTTAEGNQAFEVTFTIGNGGTVTAPAPQTAPAGAFTGVTEGEMVSGTLSVQSNTTVVPNVRKVYYYINGTIIDRVYKSPFALNFDSSALEAGSHTLVIAYATGDSDFLNPAEFVQKINFTTGSNKILKNLLTTADLTTTPATELAAS